MDGSSWPLARAWSEAALALATPEAYRAENADAQISDERLRQRVERRRAFALAHRGWAAYNLGDLDASRAAFAEAEPITARNFVGVAATPLDRFRAEAAIARGDLEQAEQLLAADAVMGGSSRALESLRAVFERRTGSAEGFEQYLESTRQRLARPAADFALADYGGESVSLGSRSGKVVLLAFWFPT